MMNTMHVNRHHAPSDWPAPQNQTLMVNQGPVRPACHGHRAAGRASVAVERHLMGGDCLNYGCVPSKGMIRAATAWADVRDAGTYGIHVNGEVEVDFASVMERMRLRATCQRLHRFTMPESSFGFRPATSLKRMVKPAFCQCGHFATGARATVPPVPGITEAGYHTNETVFTLTERPSRVGVIGGGPIGCELAQTFQRLGAQVTLFDIADQILIKEDTDAAAIIHQALLRDGVEIRLGIQIQGIESQGDEKVLTYTDAEGQTAKTAVDTILVSAGRAPNVEGMGLEAAGVTYDPRTGVQVNDNLKTTNPHIYAAGDVCSRYQFTHAADFCTVIANTPIQGRKGLGANDSMVYVYRAANHSCRPHPASSRSGWHRHRHIHPTPGRGRPCDFRRRDRRICQGARQKRHG